MPASTQVETLLEPGSTVELSRDRKIALAQQMLAAVVVTEYHDASSLVNICGKLSVGFRARTQQTSDRVTMYSQSDPLDRVPEDAVVRREFEIYVRYKDKETGRCAIFVTNDPDGVFHWNFCALKT